MLLDGGFHFDANLFKAPHPKQLQRHMTAAPASKQAWFCWLDKSASSRLKRVSPHHCSCSHPIRIPCHWELFFLQHTHWIKSNLLKTSDLWNYTHPNSGNFCGVGAKSVFLFLWHALAASSASYPCWQGSSFKVSEGPTKTAMNNAHMKTMVFENIKRIKKAQLCCWRCMPQGNRHHPTRCICSGHPAAWANWDKQLLVCIWNTFFWKQLQLDILKMQEWIVMKANEKGRLGTHIVKAQEKRTYVRSAGASAMSESSKACMGWHANQLYTW